MNSRGAIAGWIADPQKIKPGTQMPENNLAPEDLRSLLEYIETLK
jgi:cytochrome c oxidase subunit 2